MNNHFRAVLFDLDGTLLNTIDDLAISMNTVLSRHGFTGHPVEDYKHFVGEGIEKLVSRALSEKKQLVSISDLVFEMKEEYDRHWNIRTKPYDGIPALLKNLKDSQFRLAVLSNKPDEFTKKMVPYFFPDAGFDCVIGASDYLPMKPDPAGALEISTLLKIPPEEFIFLGDSGTDMRTALHAGMFAVGALWGFRPKEELEKAGAHQTIRQPSDLLELIRR